MPTTKSIAAPSSPMLTVQPPDDIPDPVVPDGTLDVDTHEKPPSVPQAPFAPQEAPQPLPGAVPALPDALVPLAHGFCQYVQHLLGTQLHEAGVHTAKSVDATLTDMANFTKGILASNEHASYQLSDALSKFQEHGLPLLSPPYQAVLRVETSAGYPLALTITKSTSGALIEELGKVEGWLQANGYKPLLVSDVG